MAKAGGGGGGAGAGGHGALTWVVSGAAGRAGVRVAALFPARGAGGGGEEGALRAGGGREDRETRPPGRTPRRGGCQPNPPPRPFLSSLPRRRFERATRT